MKDDLKELDEMLDFSKKNTDNDSQIDSIDIEDKNDNIIEKDYLSASVDQGEKGLSFYVDNIYENEEKRTFKNKMKLKKSPPSLVIVDDKGTEVVLDMTENLTEELSIVLDEIQRAYYGFSGPRDINAPKGFKNRIIYFLKKNKLKVAVGIILVIYIVSLNL